MSGLAFLALASAQLLPSALAAAKESAKKAADTFMFGGDKWRTVYDDMRKKAYYYNFRTGQSTWSDPRKAAEEDAHRWMVLIVIMLPFVLCFAAGAAYLVYVRVNHPDVLKGPKKPTKSGYTHSLAKAAKASKGKGPKQDEAAAAAAAAPADAAAAKKDN
mmetsp:Transcript_22186/g.48434  ORF Transcript_22186/g.48434 Transcript_22186/m.48434 type:complete len:160 (+) Transcript_22186:103-582(+)